MDNSKEPIRLRQRKMPTGRTSLYLDIYRKGKREYEYLHLYLVPENTRADKEKNRETLKLADAIRAKRVVELRNGEYDFKDAFASETLFFDYYEAMCAKRAETVDSQGNWGNWRSCLHHLRIYEPRKDIAFKEITPQWIEGFKRYLDKEAIAFAHDDRERTRTKKLSTNTKMSYFNKLRACVNQAFEEGIIPINPLRGIEGIKGEEGTRMYLTLEEVQRLAQADCTYPEIKRAFLFSCLTGLRRSDIERLTWNEVYQQGEFTRIIFKQKKTGGLEYLDLAPQAAELLGKRGKPEDNVFGYLLTTSTTNKVLQLWVMRAGIDKQITFHCGRHTFATLMLDLGTDIYTVSKLLGHRDVSTTAIYTKVLDKNKQAAVSRIPDLFSQVKSEDE